jgi:hypothetical protein
LDEAASELAKSGDWKSDSKDEKKEDTKPAEKGKSEEKTAAPAKTEEKAAAATPVKAVDAKAAPAKASASVADIGGPPSADKKPDAEAAPEAAKTDDKKPATVGEKATGKAEAAEKLVEDAEKDLKKVEKLAGIGQTKLYT